MGETDSAVLLASFKCITFLPSFQMQQPQQPQQSQPQQPPQPQQSSQPQSQTLGLQAMQPQQPLVRPGVLESDMWVSSLKADCILHVHKIVKNQHSLNIP